MSDKRSTEIYRPCVGGSMSAASAVRLACSTSAEVSVRNRGRVKIYVASSWRNERQPRVIELLRTAGYEVYDFRNPRDGDNGFHWSEIDPAWKRWSPEQYREGLRHPVAENGFQSDMIAMQWADVFVGVQPFGRSASLEMGWAAGMGKRTLLLLDEGEPELMVKMLDHFCCDFDELLSVLSNEAQKRTSVDE